MAFRAAGYLGEGILVATGAADIEVATSSIVWPEQHLASIIITPWLFSVMCTLTCSTLFFWKTCAVIVVSIYVVSLSQVNVREMVDICSWIFGGDVLSWANKERDRQVRR